MNSKYYLHEKMRYISLLCFFSCLYLITDKENNSLNPIILGIMLYCTTNYLFYSLLDVIHDLIQEAKHKKHKKHKK